jgi:hypothetical protein
MINLNEKVSSLAERLSLVPANVSDGERIITSGYAGDLLSWVMGRAKADSVWVTVMSNKNVIAVASLADVACVIIAEGAKLDDDALAAAHENDINVFYSGKNMFEICRAVSSE